MAQVLIVDFDLGRRLPLRQALEAAGHSVLDHADPMAAFRRLWLQEHPTVVIIHRYMDEESGEAFLFTVDQIPRLRERHAYIFLNGDVKPFSRQLQELLVKLDVPVLKLPVSGEHLVACVSEVARKRGFT